MKPKKGLFCIIAILLSPFALHCTLLASIPDTSRAVITLRLAMEHIEDKDFENALTLAGEALRLVDFQQNPSPEFSSEALKCKADALTGMKRFNEAKITYQDAILVRRKIPDTLLFLGKTYLDLGICYRLNGEPEKAIPLQKLAISYLTDALGEANEKVAFALFVTGKSFGLQGDYQKQIEYCEMAVHSYERIYPRENANLVEVYNDIATCMDRQKNYTEEVEYLEKIVALLEKDKEKDREALGKAHYSMAFPLFWLGNKKRAIEKFYKALDYFQQIYPPNHGTIGKTWSNLSFVYGAMGNHERLITLSRKAEEILGKAYGSTHQDISTNYRYQTLYYRAHKKSKAALKVCQKGICALIDDYNTENYFSQPPLYGISSDAELIKLLSIKVDLLTELYDEEGSPKTLRAAFATCQTGVDFVYQFFLGFPAIVNPDFLQQGLYFLERSLDISAELSKFGDDKAASEAFVMTEKGRAIVLANALGEKGYIHFSGIPDSLVQIGVRLKAEVVTLEQNVREIAHSPEFRKHLTEYLHLEDSLKEVLRKDRKQYAAFVKNLEQLYPAYMELKYNKSTANLETVRKNILQQKPDAMMLAFFSGHKRIHLFAISTDTLIQTVIPQNVRLNKFLNEYPELLQKDIRNMANIARDSLNQSLREGGSALYQMLLASTLERPEFSQINRLYILPDRELYNFPFETLISDSDNRKGQTAYLIRKYEIGYLSSINLHPHRNQNFATEFDLIAFSTPQVTPSLPRMEHQLESLEAICKLWGGNSMTYPDASDTLFKENADKAQLLHLHVHAGVNLAKSMDSWLWLGSHKDSTDGKLQAWELFSLNLPARLVVITAAKISSGFRNGIGLSSLVQGFHYAGIPTITLSLWQGNQDAKDKILLSFYRNLSEGKSTNQALRLAKLQYLNEGGPSFPNSWAAMVSYGENQIIKPPSLSPLLLCLMLGILGIGIGGVIFYFKQKKA